MSKFIKSPNFLLILISLAFIIIPFFWLKPGDMDLGGDSTRLYFYDPIAYLRSFSLYNVAPEGLGGIAPNYYFIPYMFLIAGVKVLVHSPTFVIYIFNIIKLLGAFLAMYFFVLELLKIVSHSTEVLNDREKFSALLAGLFYVFSPFITGNWSKALTSHNQIFLNPLMFLLVFKFLTTNKTIFIWLALFLSILFAPNFGFTSAPALFSFYPLAFIFLAIFLFLTKVNKVSLKKVFLMVILFVGLHAFHLLPQIINLFEPGSFANTRVFDRTSIAQEGIRYFYGVLPLSKVSTNILLSWPSKIDQLLFSIVPLIILLAFITLKKKQPIFLLTGMFFLLTLFLLSANITQSGVELYKSLFYIPGFTMFRNFIGQWGVVFSFFYALLFAQALMILFDGISRQLVVIVSLIIIISLVIPSLPFLRGDLVNTINSGSNNIPIPLQMDPRYEATLGYIKELPDDDKMLMLPFSDSFYQVLAGKNGGAYVSSSSISYLTDRKTFSGYQVMSAPFSEKLFAMSREKDYEGIQRLMTYINIKYVFYNSDPRIYDTDFPSSPYTYARQSLPTTQKEYKQFVARIADRKIYENGPYQIFSVKESNYLPLFYTAKEVDFYTGLNKEKLPDPSLFLNKKNEEIATVYIDIQNCPKAIFTNCQKSIKQNTNPKIFFTEIDPTRYKIKVENAKNPYVLVFQNAYHPQWKVFLSDKEIAGDRHFMGNGYANVWYIDPKDTNSLENYELSVEMTEQRVFYGSLLLSSILFILFMGWGVLLFFPKVITAIIRQSHA